MEHGNLSIVCKKNRKVFAEVDLIKAVVAWFLWFVNIHKLEPPFYNMIYKELLDLNC